VKLLLDETIEEVASNIVSKDPLEFEGTKKYSDQLKEAQSKTGSKDAVSTYIGVIGGFKTAIAIMDFRFIGGSMGSVVGEKISQVVDKAREEKLPLFIVTASGGARMQEGAYSLMQMAKISSKLARFSKEGGLYITLLTDPTTGGTTASFAMLGDIILAEPNALIGFAGARVIKQTIGEDLPEGFQRAEFLLEKGFVDSIVHRKELKHTLVKLFDFFGYKTNKNLSGN
jgi:acetyl-CoA carboxylase carboxyl transferase subunit beta